MHVYAPARRCESGARACANERCTMRASSSSNPLPSISSSSSQHAAISRAATSTWTACVLSRLHARQACKRLTGDRYLGSVVWLSTETLPRGASSHSDRLSLMENARRVRFDSAGCDCRYATPPTCNIGQLHR